MTEQRGKIALRREGMWWVAYWSSENADKIMVSTELARIRMNLAEGSADVKTGFIALVQVAMNVAIEASGGKAIVWNVPKRGPEAERSGNA